MRRSGHRLVVIVAASACGPSVDPPSAKDATTSTSTSTSSAATSTTTQPAASSGGGHDGSSTGCDAPPDGAELELEGQLLYESSHPFTYLKFVPCSQPQWSFAIQGDVRGLRPCGGTFARVRGTVRYPADPCFAALEIQQVVESRDCASTDCAAPCETKECLSFVTCSVFKQDCPEGEKCGPTVSEYRDVYDGVNCSSLDDSPANLGEMCRVYDLATGRDSCDLGLVCLGWNDDELGACAPACSGTDEGPLCPTDRTCVTTGGGALNLCLTPCDPASPNCPAGAECVARGGIDVCLDRDDVPRILDNPDP